MRASTDQLTRIHQMTTHHAQVIITRYHAPSQSYSNTFHANYDTMTVFVFLNIISTEEQYSLVDKLNPQRVFAERHFVASGATPTAFTPRPGSLAENKLLSIPPLRPFQLTKN